MRKINKGIEPHSLTQFKNNFPNGHYDQLVENYIPIRIDIREACVKEQFHLCAYCCDRISSDKRSSHNEHFCY